MHRTVSLAITVAIISLVGFSYHHDAYALKTITADTTGGDCSSIGTWNVTSKTCTLGSNLSEGIVIGSNNVMLDGNGHSITGTYSNINPGTFGDGVLLGNTTGIIIKNIIINNCNSGIHLISSNGNTIQGNTLSNDGYSIQMYNSSNNQINSNIITTSPISGYGIFLDLSNGNTISNNALSGATMGLITENSYSGTIYHNSFKNTGTNGIYLAGVGGYYLTDNVLILNGQNGIQIDGGGGHTIVGNIISSNTHSGIRLTGYANTISNNIINSNSEGILMLSGWAITSSSNVIKNNNFSNNLKGIFMNGSSNQVYNNNFLTNTLQAAVNGSGNVFDQGSITGGNYWSDYSPNCVNNSPFDKFCDNPYVFSGGKDDYPWVNPNGLMPSPPLFYNTTITLNPISSVPWSNKITVSGQMVDQYENGVTGATISFNGTGGGSIASITTDVNGLFTTTGAAPNTVQTGWTVQAHFAGNSTLNPSDSNIITYSTTSHHTSLSLTQPPNARWSQPTSFVATLLDLDNGGMGISGNSIHFNGTGVIGVTDANTNSNGIATGHGTAPPTIKPGWTAEATFTTTGNLYIGSNSSTLKYNTLKHPTSLTMIIKPDPVHHNAKYNISGILKDLTTSTGMSTKTIQFVTNNSAVVIPPILTNSTGGYTISGLVAPNLAGKSVQIQATYNTQSLYGGTAVLKLLKIT